MMDKKDNSIRPIFIIGSYRSGTSVLTWCLGQHPNILPLEETNWIGYLSIYSDYLYHLGTVNKEHSHLGSIGISKDSFYSFLGKSIDNFIREHIGSYLEAANRRGIENPELVTEFIQIHRSENDSKDRWIDGTPENSHFVYGLNKLFPGAKFIHILRNPKQVATSLMHFSSVGGVDYPEDEAYKTWMRLVRASVEAERALGAKRVLRVYYDDILKSPENLIKTCLAFVGEWYDVNCLLPLQRKINASKYQKVANDSIEENIQSSKPYEREAFELYSSLLSEKSPSEIPDAVSYDTAESKFLEFAKQFGLEEVRKLREWGDQLNESVKERNLRIRELQAEVEKLGAWGKELDDTVRQRDQRIQELQDEVEKLGAWGKELDDTVRQREQRIEELKQPLNLLKMFFKQLSGRS